MPSPASCPWSDFAPPTIEFCEARLCAWVAEPANTYSNLGFVVVGLYILWRCRKRSSPLRAIGVSSVLLGIGSGLFHATAVFWGEALDLIGMFLISGLLVSFSLQRLLLWPRTRIVPFFASLVGASTVMLLLIRPSGIPVFAAQLVAWTVIEFKLYKRAPAQNYRHLRAMGIAFGIAFVVWLSDITGALCDPNNHILTGHAVWHLLDAAALYFFYRHQETLTAQPQQQALTASL